MVPGVLQIHKAVHSACVENCLRTSLDTDFARDIAPLGAVSKTDAKKFLNWAQEKWNLLIINEFLTAVPTAELLPLSAGVQDDESENEMGLTYEELSTFGRLRSIDRLGPWSCYLRLLADWKDRPGFGPKEIAGRVLRFFRFYAINRHKSTILTPSIHLEAYNPEDNRHDLRPFLYVVSWPWQAKKIEQHAEELCKLAEKKKENDSDVD